MQGGLRGVRGRVLQGVRRPGEALDHHGRAQRDRHRRLRQRRLPALPLLAAVRDQLHRGELLRRALHRRPQLRPGARRRRQALQRKVPGHAEGRRWHERLQHLELPVLDEPCRLGSNSEISGVHDWLVSQSITHSLLSSLVRFPNY